MRIGKRLTAIIASGLALASTPETQAWKEPRPLGPGRPSPGVSPGVMPMPPLPADEAPTAASAQPGAQPQPRALAVFASGFVMVAVAFLAAVVLWMLPRGDALPVTAQPGPVLAPPPASASAALASCPLQPAAPAASEKDGLFPLQAGVEGLIAADIRSFIAIGNQAAATGRPRDAEAAFLMACRVAEKLGGPGSVESADAKYQLGAHYAALALASPGAAPQRAELLARAERLYADSAQTYVARYSQADEKSQRAAQGLAAVRQSVEQAQAPQPVQPAQPVQPVQPPLPTQTAPTAQPVPRPEIASRSQAYAGRVAPADGQARARQRPSVVRECLPAVATLGLCEPAP